MFQCIHAHVSPHSMLPPIHIHHTPPLLQYAAPLGLVHARVVMEMPFWSCRGGSWIQWWQTARLSKAMFPVVAYVRVSLKHRTRITCWHDDSTGTGDEINVGERWGSLGWLSSPCTVKQSNNWLLMFILVSSGVEYFPSKQWGLRFITVWEVQIGLCPLIINLIITVCFR